MTYSVRTVPRADDAPQALWDKGFAPPIEGKWWYQVFEQSGLDDQFEFLYAIVERDGQAVGLAPMFVADVPIELVVPDELFPTFKAIGRVFPGVLAQRTLFVGSPCADDCGVERHARSAGSRYGAGGKPDRFFQHPELSRRRSAFSHGPKG